MAVEKLKDRGRLPNEGTEVFADKIKELVKSAYPKFNDDALALLTKGYYVKGLHTDIQKELRKHEAYEDKPVDDLVPQTILLEIAGKNSSRAPEETFGSIKGWTSLEAKMDRLLSVCEKSSRITTKKIFLTPVLLITIIKETVNGAVDGGAKTLQETWSAEFVMVPTIYFVNAFRDTAKPVGKKAMMVGRRRAQNISDYMNRMTIKQVILCVGEGCVSIGLNINNKQTRGMID